MSGAASGTTTVRWNCEPQLAGTQWVLRCDDFQAQLDDDPALQGHTAAAWYVPT